jgi:hypothetical protein
MLNYNCQIGLMGKEKTMSKSVATDNVMLPNMCYSKPQSMQRLLQQIKLSFCHDWVWWFVQGKEERV